MSGSLIEVLMENERRTNRSCAIACLWVAAVCAAICIIGLTGALFIDRRWMAFYAVGIVLPATGVGVYAKLRDYRGSEIKHLMVLASALVPSCMAVPSLFGFFLMPLPIVVAGRYFSRPFVWHTYGCVVLLTVFLMIPHTLFGTPCLPVCDEARDLLQTFLDGRFDLMRYWRYQVVACIPSFAICLSFFAITVSRLCKDHLEAMALDAKKNARLADIEKGLAIAATMEIMGEREPKGEVEGEDGAPDTQYQAPSTNQPKVDTWSTQAIADCIAKCKKRAAEDPAFAALVECDPSAAVREVQAGA